MSVLIPNMETLKHSVLNACRRLLKPLVRLLLKSGISWQEFAEVSKQIYVDVALEDYGIKGRPTNLSRVAILTGINRKDAKRYRDNPVVTPSPRKTSEATQVLDGWHHDTRFLDDQCKPIALFESIDERKAHPNLNHIPVFADLYKEYGGDIPQSALLKELLNTQTLARDSDGRLRVIKRFYMPQQLDEESVIRAGEVLQDIGDTVVHNLTRRVKERSRFEGRATHRNVSATSVNDFKDFLEHQGMDFLESVDDWLDQHQASEKEIGVRMGVGLYFIQGDANKERQS